MRGEWMGGNGPDSIRPGLTRRTESRRRPTVEKHLTEVMFRPNEAFEAGLRRFNKRVQQDGVLAESRRRKQFEKPSVRRKKKQAARARKARRAAMKAARQINHEYAF